MCPHHRSPSLHFLLVFCLAICGGISSAQTTNQGKPEPVFGDPRTGKRVTIPRSPGFQPLDTTRRDSVVNFVVRLRTSPVAKNASGRVARAAQVDREHDDFLSKLGEISGSINARNAGANKTIRVLREYKKTFNGFALNANSSFLESIKRMPHVVSVTEDRQVKANDEVSNEVVRAPRVWNEVGATGTGVKIGIIDSGIDYMHPDLGAGIGATFKVAGGYDFVNNDPDPMDDHGHGTHVAGIAAAKGTTKGIAPDAKLYGIKVLDQYGNGWDSQIIAGIEYAVDPDGNPATDDGMDVVNMSLGRAPGGADDPMSEAVNNAVAMGVCFVIAAGNNYEYFRIGTPAIARDAITVGATDNFDYTASFSSRGPLPDSFMLKPDVGAPGVQINSTYLGSQYKRLDGTSMASPHVAGVAALILGKHPEWTPADVKAAVMGTARMNDFTRFLETGAGIVDAYKAVTTDIIMSPASISYGRIPASENTWKRHDVIKVTNKAQTSQQMQLVIEGFANETAIDISITPNQFIVAPGATQEVSVDIEVDVSLLENRAVPEGYLGAVTLTSGSKKMKTLLSLFNPAITTIEFKSLPSNFIVGGHNNGYWQAFYPTKKEVEVMLPEGKYDILAWFRNPDTVGDSLVVIEEHEATLESKKVLIDSKMATNRIEFKPVDDANEPLALGNWGGTAMLGPTTITFWAAPVGVFYMSDSKKHGFYLRTFHIPEDPERVYEIALSSGLGISDSKIVSNDPNQFRRIIVTNPSLSPGQPQDFYFHTAASALGSYNTLPLRVPNPLNVYLFEDPMDRTISYYRFLPPPGTGGFSWETSMLNNSPERGQEFVSYWGIPIQTIEQDPFDFTLGRSLLNFTGMMSNDRDKLAIFENGPHGVYNHAYGERTAGNVSWTLSSNNQVISSGMFFNSTQDDNPWFQFEKEIDRGTYKMSLKWDSYYVGGSFSDVTTDLEFSNYDNVYFDFSPPAIEDYIMRSEGRITNTLEAGKGGDIRVKLSDYNLQTTTLEMRPLHSDTWVSLPLAGTSDAKTTIPSDIPPGLYSLRLKAADKAGNRITHTLSPAFAVGPQPVTVPFTKVSPVRPPYYDIDAGVSPVFEWTSVTNAVYTFQISRTAGFEQLLAEEEVNTTTLSLPAALEKDATYYWRVKAKTGDVQLPWSRTYVFVASKLAPAVLLSPAKDSRDVPIAPTEFKWTPTARTDWQTLEISNNKEFTDIVYSTGLQRDVSKYSTTFLQEGKQYYWRMTTWYYTFYRSYNLVSDAYPFTTFLTVGLEDGPDVPRAFPNPFTDKVQITVFARQDDMAKVTLYDHLGRPVSVSQHSLLKGENVLEAGGDGEADLAAGVYVAVVDVRGKRWRVRVVKR